MCWVNLKDAKPMTDDTPEIDFYGRFCETLIGLVLSTSNILNVPKIILTFAKTFEGE